MSTRLRLRSAGLAATAFFATATVHAADLGARVAYQLNTPLPFADFTLTYTGERRILSQKFPPGMVFYDFRVVSPQGTQTVSWSAGTGDIGPVLFHVDGKAYALELQHSDKLGPLKPNELVVSRSQESAQSRLRPVSSGSK